MSDGSSNGCLLIICPGCQNVLLKCKFIFHCENECKSVEMHCINRSFGCSAIINRYLMNDHLINLCQFKIRDNCSCNNTIENVIETRMKCVEHCQNCIMSLCTYAFCRMKPCVNACGGRLHECKMLDHVEMICENAIVDCVNRAYGCPAQMVRRLMGRHVRKCRASVVTCTREWSRRVQGCKLYQASLDGHQDSKHWCRQLHEHLLHRSNRIVDGNFLRAMSLRDQLYLCTALNDLSTIANGFNKSSHQGSTMVPNYRTSLMGRPISSELINKHRYGSSGDQCLLMASRFIKYPVSLWSSSSQYWPLITDQLDAAASSVASSPAPMEDESSWTVNEPEFDNGVKHLTWDQEKPLGTYTFQCGQTVPREEWEGHWRQHCDISAQMDGWVEQTCPMAYLGCKFSVVRFSKSLSSSLAYHPLLDTYCQRFSSPALQPDIKSGSAPFSLLLLLPFEVLVRVCSFLDGCSLFHASRTHPRLEQAIDMLLDRCCVSLDWQRSSLPHQSWTSRITWFRPTSLRCINVVSGNSFTPQAIGALSEHLKHCAFKEPLSSGADVSPFCLHRLNGCVSPISKDEIKRLPEFLRSTCR